MNKEKKLILWFRELSKTDVGLVGGKNSSLGEMFSKLTQKGINVPDGFATTSFAYWYFLEKNNLLPKLKEIFKKLDFKNVASLQEAGRRARNLVMDSEFPEDLKKEISGAYKKLSKEYGEANVDVAARSSATAEDLPTASFAGAHETYLNIKGETEVLKAVKKCIASLFNDRAISYREEKGFDQFKVALSVGVMKMVRSDIACSGVIFTLDTESGFEDVVIINGSWGLGEMVVKGKVIPDEFMVFKPTLKQGFKPIVAKKMGTKVEKMIYSTGVNSVAEIVVPIKDRNKFVLDNEEILQLAKWAVAIENHYGMHMDIEWAKDGKTKKLFIVQARPETVHAEKAKNYYTEYILKDKGSAILEGSAIGTKIATGKVRLIPDVSRIKEFKPGEILVTKMTDPDWEPIMKVASGVITEEGSRVCHAAIVSRELGIPAIVGVAKATASLKNGQSITMSCAEGEKGRIYDKELAFEIKKYDLKEIPKTETKIMLNTGHPDSVFSHSFLPNAGVGLAREEFIINSQIKIHPLALYNFEKIKDQKTKKQINEMTFGFSDKKEYFIEKLAQGVGKIAAAFYPKPVIVRLSDFKSNEYAELIGGKPFEPIESNPMIGWRGASRYYDDNYKPAFEMECKAIKRARDGFGFKNIWVMVPFCRTPEEGKNVLKIMAENGLAKSEELKVIVMCEIPSNVILADEFLEIFDGMSIGSNDLTQLVLGLDRDSAQISKVGDERNGAVKKMISEIIKVCREKKKYIGICGEAPSNYPDFAEFLVQEGIESMSLNPDTVIKTTLSVAKKEAARKVKNN
jgi:pyruvate, water dikinase